MPNTAFRLHVLALLLLFTEYDLLFKALLQCRLFWEIPAGQAYPL